MEGIVTVMEANLIKALGLREVKLPDYASLLENLKETQGFVNAMRDAKRNKESAENEIKRRLAEIQLMPDGPKKAQMLAGLKDMVSAASATGLNVRTLAGDVNNQLNNTVNNVKASGELAFFVRRDALL